MKLSKLVQHEKYSYLEIDKVVYDKQGSEVAFQLQSSLPVDDQEHFQLSSLLEDLFQCAVKVNIELLESVEKELNSTPSNYDEPIIISRPKKEKVAEAVRGTEDGFLLGRKFTARDYDNYVALDELGNLGGPVVTSGKISEVNQFTTKTGLMIITYHVENLKGGAITCKSFVHQKDQNNALANITEGNWVMVKGSIAYDSYANANVLTVEGMTSAEPELIIDDADTPRVEFAVHTQMSNMEGMINPKDLAKKVKEWGHSAVGVTDFGSVQAYPLVYNALQGSDVKVLFGYEAKTLRQNHHILSNVYQLDIDKLKGSYTVFDIETTGFSRFNDRIIEIGAVRYEDGNIVGEFSEFVYPERTLPEKIIELTGITDAMLKDAPTIDQVLLRFLTFAKDSIFVAHNADFDIGFIVENAKKLNLDFQPVYIDTLGLARALHPEYKNHKLDTLTKNLNVNLFNHHRASDDARATGIVFLKLIEEWAAFEIPLTDINETPSDYELARHDNYRTIVYVKEQKGLYNLYQLVSKANIETFFRSPGVSEKDLQHNREGLLLMTGFVDSELFDAISRRYPNDVLLKIASRYDVLCVQPPAYWEKALQSELVENEDHFKDIVEKIIQLARKLEKPCIAINMPYYFNPGDRLARNILVNYQRRLEFEREERYRFFTTKEMLNHFDWLGRETAYHLVVTATRDLADSFEEVRPIPQGTFTPELENAEEDLRQSTYEKAESIYGKPLPDLVEARLERELSSIINNGYASLYIIAKKLVEKSNEDGYLVGSRGSVGSSFAATMANITEVNPLSPHYVCPSCKYSEFITDHSVGSGFDLPAKDCPECGTTLNRDGQEIPFEVFLGFEGDKEPDIDLNFAGSYMSTIHKFTEEFFGKGKVFRAGTISGVQSKTAYGLIRKYLEQAYIPQEDEGISEARISSLQRIMEGTRRTTGQHAGGLIIVPSHLDVLDFTPIQYPADDPKSGTITTHFSYKNLEGTLLKLDELGHTSPTIIRQLQEMTDVDPLLIQFDDPKTMEIFSNTKTLDIRHDYSNKEDGSLGIPEFGTGFVRGMLSETKPTTFAELTRISGLSHGTNVWLNNAQELIRDGITTLSGSICTRDDIMIYLISMGMDKLDSFKTMESVRKGRGIPEGIEEKMRDHKVPSWYIDSCQKIQYMFPKSHAAAYVMMSYRIAWFKVHSPAAFYATYYTQRLSDFSTGFLFSKLDQVQNYMKDLKNAEEEKASDANKWTLLEVIEEMYARDYVFAEVDLYNSKACDFSIIDDRTILPPLSALNDVSEALAEAIVREREAGFISKQEFKTRTNANRSALASMEEYGLLESLPESNQMSFIPGF